MIATLPNTGRVHSVLPQLPFAPVVRRRTCRTRQFAPVVATAAAMPFTAFSSPEFSNTPLFPSTPAKTRQVASADVGPDTGFRTGFSQQYSKGHQLGQGSFGTVFRGISLQTGAEVAIKSMPKVRGKLSKDATLEKICREIDFLERVQGCRGIIEVVDTYEEPQEMLVVTEMCSGGDLQRLSDAYPVINERCLALIATEVLKVIKACNEHGITHGDIKPANFVLKHPLNNPLFSMDPAYASASWLKVIDFGCSQVIPAPGAVLTKRAGTPVFMAPDIFERSYGREADVWSAGVMLYQMFCKRFPFWDTYEQAKSSRIDDIAVAVLNAEMRLDFGPWLNMSPEGLSFIKGLLTRDKGDRLTVTEALAHPWLAMAMGQTAAPAPTATARVAGNNIVRRPAVHRPQVAVVAH